MNAGLLVLAAVVNWFDASPVPGQCAEPAAVHAGEPGCFLVGELRLKPQADPLWWHIYEFPTAREAAAAAARHANALTAASHGRAWLHILADAAPPPAGGIRRASIGPLTLPRKNVPIAARFLESVFPPGMRTRVHSHPGPEAFYVIEGQQCMETPSERRKINAGESFIVAPGPHVQAAPQGRKNIAIVLSANDEPWMSMAPDWTPSQYCAN